MVDCGVVDDGACEEDEGADVVDEGACEDDEAGAVVVDSVG